MACSFSATTDSRGCARIRGGGSPRIGRYSVSSGRKRSRCRIHFDLDGDVRIAEAGSDPDAQSIVLEAVANRLDGDVRDIEDELVDLVRGVADLAEVLNHVCLLGGAIAREIDVPCRLVGRAPYRE